MSDASSVIAQQFKDGGVIPGKLGGQDTVSKTYVDGQLVIRDKNTSAAATAAGRAQSDIDNHKRSIDAHNAQSISYYGKIPVKNVNQAIDSVDSRINGIVASAGESNTEIVDARQPATGEAFPVLGARLNAVDTQLAEYAAINVKSYGAKGNWNGTTSTDDTAAIQAAFDVAGKNEVLFPMGFYYVSRPIIFKNYAKIRFDGSIIVTDESFQGDAVFYCDSADINDGEGNGYMINPSFLAAGNYTNAAAVMIEYCKSIKIYNLNTTGYIRGGLIIKAGYELLLFGFNVRSPNIPTRDYPILQPGVDLRTSDCEVSGGAVVGYPVGVKTFAANNFTNVHCWGIPSTGNASDIRVMLYPFVTTEKANAFVNCYADTPDLLDINGSGGGLNGGIGFYEAPTSLYPKSYPTENRYIACRVYKHPSSVSGKIIGFSFGDAVENGGKNFIGMYTTIISPSFVGEGYGKLIHNDHPEVTRPTAIILSTSRGIQTELGVQRSIITDTRRIKMTAGLADDTYITKLSKMLTLRSTPVKIFDPSEVSFFCIDHITLANNTSGTSAGTPARIRMTSDGTVVETTTFTPLSTTINTEYQVALIKWWDNLSGSAVYIQRTSSGWFIRCEHDLNRLILLEITLR